MPTTTATLLIVTLLTVAATIATSSDCIVDATSYRSLIEENEDLVHCVTSKYTENGEDCTIDELQEGFASSDAIDVAQCVVQGVESSIACYCNDKCTEDELSDLLGALEQEDPYLEVSCAESFLESWRLSRSPNLQDETQPKSQNLPKNGIDELDAPLGDSTMSEMEEYGTSSTTAETTTAVSSTEEFKEATEATTPSVIAEKPSSSTTTKPKKITQETTLFDELWSPSTREDNVPGIPKSPDTPPVKTSQTRRSTEKRTSEGKTRSTRPTTTARSTRSTSTTRSTQSTTRATTTSRTPGTKSRFSTTRGFSTKPGKTNGTGAAVPTQTKPGNTNGTTKIPAETAKPQPSKPDRTRGRNYNTPHPSPPS
ncbi:hypothetical protein Aduo_011026 [Ancylostoma duodenale]